VSASNVAVYGGSMPLEGERVTVAIKYGIHRGWARSPVELLGSRAFTVVFQTPNLVDGGETHLWSFDPAFVEGVGWARGWDTEDARALEATVLLQRSAG